VTDVPWQMLFWLTRIETLTGRGLFTVIVTVLEVAGFPEMHGRLEFMKTYTWSPLAGIYV
jgi:hypothetical protein